MASLNGFSRWLLAIGVLAAVGGCASRCGDGCDGRGGCCLGRALCGVYHGTLADEVMCCGRGCLDQAGDACGGPPCSRCGPDCGHCRECCWIPLGLAGPLVEKPTPGPPPATFRPPMPPKFLPVPTAPTVSPVRPEAPEPERGDVEVGYRTELTSPGRD